jgi:hypothetical protein
MSDKPKILCVYCEFVGASVRILWICRSECSYIKCGTDGKTNIYFLKNLSVFVFVFTRRNDEIRTPSSTSSIVIRSHFEEWWSEKLMSWSSVKKTYALTFTALFFFKWLRARQQTLREHRSLEASCATLWWRWWRLFFVLFQVMEHRWNEIDRRKPKYSEKNLSQCHFVHHKSHMDWAGIEPGPPRWEAGD